MKKDEFRVKGSSIQTKLAYAADHLGPEASEKLRSFLVANGLPAQILEGSWYPFAVFDGFLRLLADLAFGGSLAGLREVGRYSATMALKTTYAIYADTKDFGYFLTRIGSFHRRYYSKGDLVAHMDEDGMGCTLIAFGAPGYSEADLQVAAGFYVGAAEHMGLGNVVCEFETSRDGARFRLSWGD